MTIEQTLATCPCGQIPPRLVLCGEGERPKYAYVSGYCCGEWHVEFRSEWRDLTGDETMALARAAWNRAQRGSGSKSVEDS